MTATDRRAGARGSALMQDAIAYCRALVAAADPDRSLATAFAPKKARDALIALYAFNAELARIREAVKEPLAGEIRLQWWREVLVGHRQEEARGHPVALAVLDAVRQHELPLRLFEQLIEARRTDLRERPIDDLATLETYARGTSSTVMELAARVLVRDCLAGDLAFAGPAGIGYAMTGLLRKYALPGKPSGQTIAADVSLSKMRECAASSYAHAVPLIVAARRELAAAWLPLALVPLYLRALERGQHEPRRAPDVSVFRKVWALWRAARNGRPQML